MSQPMMRILIVLLALTIPAAAQEVPIPACLPHDEMAAELLKRAKESPVGLGIADKPLNALGQKMVLEIYASKAGTWTVVLTDPADREACIKAYGTNFQVQEPPWKERGARR